MYVCMYVCIRMFGEVVSIFVAYLLDLCFVTHTYTHAHTYTHTQTHTHFIICIHTYMHTYIYTYIHAHTHTFIYLFVCLFVYLLIENVATNKPAYQSSFYVTRVSPGKAVDGNIQSSGGYCILTNINQPFTWWEVNLGEQYFIHEVIIYFRTDCE